MLFTDLAGEGPRFIYTQMSEKSGDEANSLPPFYAIEKLAWPSIENPSVNLFYGVGSPRYADFSLYRLDSSKGYFALFTIDMSQYNTGQTS